MLGNKKDTEAKEVTAEDIAEFQAKYREVIYFETSARTGFQIADAFKTLSQKIVEKGP